MSNTSVIKAIAFDGFTTRVELPIISQSATYACSLKQTSQGDSYDHELTLKIPGTTSAIQTMINELQHTSTIYVEDVNSVRYTVFRGDQFFRFAIKHVVTGTFGSFRGFDITINLTSTRAAKTSPL